MEVAGGELIAYYEAPRPEGLNGLRIFNTLLMAELPGQTNRVNLELSTGVKTLIFRGDGDGKVVPVEFEGGD